MSSAKLSSNRSLNARFLIRLAAPERSQSECCNKSRLLKERKESVQAGLIVGGIVLFLFAGFAAVAGLKNTLCLFGGMGLFALLRWANVSETDLHEKIEIPTDFGETLSWKYLCFVRENPIIWNVPTEILYN